MHCQYYTAITNKPKTLFVVGMLRNEENIAFTRTLDTKKSILEFFVPKDTENHFLRIMDYFIRKQYVLKLEKKPNRLTS
jgi:hypothetical protein